jgi:hypothetical protein
MLPPSPGPEGLDALEFCDLFLITHPCRKLTQFFKPLDGMLGLPLSELCIALCDGCRQVEAVNLITHRRTSGVTGLSTRCRRLLLEDGQGLIERFELHLYGLELFLELIQTGELGFDYPLPCNQLSVRLMQQLRRRAVSDWWRVNGLNLLGPPRRGRYWRGIGAGRGDRLLSLLEPLWIVQPLLVLLAMPIPNVSGQALRS